MAQDDQEQEIVKNVGNGVARLPMPDTFMPKSTPRSLMMNVKLYFQRLYNDTDKTFRNLLASVGNKDAINGNRLFDRHYAVGMIKKAAKEARDITTTDAKDGDIYKCIVDLMRNNNMGLKIRRQEYKRLTHQAPAE